MSTEPAQYAYGHLMDLFDGLRGAFRRWYVLIPLLIITAAVAVVVSGRKTTQYTSTATVGVTTGSTSVQSVVPSGQPTVTRNNALVQNGGVTLVANLLSIGLNQSDVAEQVVAARGTTNYTVAVEQRGPSAVQLPIVDISATDKSARRVATTMGVLTAQADATLAKIQSTAGVPTDKYVKAFVLQPATPPTRGVLSTTRNVGVVVVVGVIVAFTLAGVVDNIVMRRRRRRADASTRSAQPTEPDEVRSGP